MFSSDSTVSQAPTFLFRLRPRCILNAQFVGLTGFYSVYRRICFPSVHSMQAPTVFIPFTTRCILNAQFVSLTGFYSVYRCICFPSVHGFAYANGLSQFLSTLIQQLPQYTRQLQPQPIYSISREKAFCFAFCRGKICKIQLFDITLPHH